MIRLRYIPYTFFRGLIYYMLVQNAFDYKPLQGLICHEKSHNDLFTIGFNNIGTESEPEQGQQGLYMILPWLVLLQELISNGNSNLDNE